MSTKKMTIEKFRGTRFNKILTVTTFLFLVTVVMNHEIAGVRYMGTGLMFIVLMWMVVTFERFINERFDKLES